MQFKESVWTSNDVKVAFLKPDIALAHVKWSLKGDKNPDGTPRPPRTGIFTQIIVKQDGRWVIADSGDVNGPFRRDVNKIGAKRRWHLP
jgi:ketosteroid isomerase-like protein